MRSFVTSLWILCTVLIPCQIRAAVELHSSLSPTQTDQDLLVGGCVNVASGAFVLEEVDTLPAGPEEIEIHRSYLSQHLWSFFPQTMLLIGGSTEKSGYSKEGKSYKYTKAICGEESGSIIAYFGWITDGQAGKLQPVSYGISNCSLGEIGGRTNLKNNKMRLTQECIEISTGNGSKRIYTKSEGQLDSLIPNILDRPLFRQLGSRLEQPDIYLLQSEIRPNGNKATYTYNEQGLLAEIRVTDATGQNLLSFVRLNYFLEETPVRITAQTSSGHEVVYLFGQDGQLEEVRTQEGWRQYQYSEEGLVRESCSDASIREIQYNASHVVQSYSTLHDHFEFSYNFSAKPATTDVLDRQGNKTRYSHTSQRVQSIDVYDAAENLQRTKKKFWGTGPEAGDLTSEVVADSQGQNVSCTTYSYDSNHNVEKERLYGNLQGAQIPSILLNEMGLPIEIPNIPCHIRKRQYSGDGFNVLINQGEPKNGSVRYEYKPGTNLLTAKLVYDKEGVKKRTYFEYDENAFLIRQTTDDGTGENKNAPFSEKHITQIVPTKDFPTGLPLVIEEKYYDRNSNQECVLRKHLTTYDTSGRITLEEVEGKDGTKKKEASYTYDQSGRRLEKTDATGATTRYSYDIYGTLVEKIQAAYTERLFYNDQRRLIGKQKQYPSGTVLEERYEYDQFGNKTSSTDMFGNTTTYEYDPLNRLVTVIHPAVTTKEGGLAHPVYRYTYDGLNRRTAMEDPSGNKTQYTYTVRGEPASTLYPDGTSEVYSYDSEGSLHRKTTPDGRLLAYNYDFLGRLIGVETFSQAKTGPGEFLGMCHYKYNTFHLVEVMDDQNYETRARYSSAGILECLEGHYGWKEGEEPPKTVFEYDAFGSESGHKEWFGSGEDDYIHTSFHTDASGHITDKTVSDSNGKILSQINYSYDSSGNRTQTAVQGEQAELIEYNEFNEPTKVIDAQGRISTFLYNHHDIDEEGQRVFTKTTIDPCGSQKIQKYDLRGLLVSQLSQTASGILLEKEKYVYDLQQNLCKKITFVVLEGSIQGQQTTLYTYDTMKRPLSIDIEGKRTTFEYDKFGLISKKYEPDYSDPIRYSYRYGLHQLLTTITYPLLDNSEASTSPYYSFNQVLLKFNSSGGLIRTTTTVDNATVERKLGFNNQVLEETISCDKTQEYTVKTAFDRMGRTKAITLPDSSSIQYRYESSFLREITRTNGYGIAQYTHNYVDYDQLGNITREECIGNTGNRLSQWAPGKQKRSIVTDFYKEFIEQDGVDLLGNILVLHAETPQGKSSSSFTYDPLSRLLSEQGLFSHTYTCDSLGNHRSIDGAFQSVDSLNRLLTSGAIINTYDRRGCLRSKTTPSGTTNLRYDIFNRLLSVASGGKSARFSYDGLGRRIAQKVELNGKETFLLFLYFNGEEIGRINSEGAIDQLKIPGLESPVAFELHKRTVAPIYDLHSNVVALIDPDTREVLESYAYSVFGEEQIFDQDNEELSRSSLDNPWRFAGKRKEAISGLILFEKRAYDPSLRCWTSPDPAGEVDGPNLYLFSRGNPLIFGDPLGLSSQSHYTHYENFETYMASERGTPCARGGELGFIEHSSEVRSQSQSGRNFVTLFSTKYSEEQIIEKLKSDPGFGRHVIGHINGMNTDYEAVLKRAKRMIESSNERIEAVLIAYNGTTGWIADTGEAIGNILRTNSQVAQDLQTGIMNFFDNFRDCKTDVRIAFHCHSQGAAIIDCILTTREFDRSNENGYAKFMGQTFTYGAATFLDLKKGEGINFWTPGDPIPLLNPRNYDIMESNPQCIKFTTFRIQHPFDAHAFESPAYQEAFQHAIEAQY